MPNEPSSFPRFTKKDLEDKDLSRLNSAFSLLFGKLTDLYGSAGPVALTSPVSAPAFTVKQTGQPKADELITFGTALKYFSPQAIRQAFVDRQFLGTAVRGVSLSDITGDLIIVGTRDERLAKYPEGKQGEGTIFWESDTRIMLLAVKIGTSIVWVPALADNVIDLHANRYAVGTVSTNGPVVTWNSGTTFYTKWATLSSEIWINGALYPISSVDGPTQITLGSTAGVQAGVAYAFSLYPSVHYPLGTLYHETDRTVLYAVEDAVGLVNTNGTAVARLSGPFFNPYWTGRTIVIGGADFVVASVPNGAMLVLTSSAGVHSGLGFTVASGAWYYAAGTFYDSTPPTDLIPQQDTDFLFHNTNSGMAFHVVTTSINVIHFSYLSGVDSGPWAALPTLGDYDAGYLFFVSDYAHRLKWTGMAWEYDDPTDFAGRIEMALVDPLPTAGWHLCDGTAAVGYLKSDGTIGSQNLPDLVSDAAHAAYLKLGGSVSGPNAAVAPGFVGNALAAHAHDLPFFVTGDELNYGPTATGGTITVTDSIVGTNIGSVPSLSSVTVAASAGTPAGSVDATGEPRNLVLRPWFRL